MWFFVERLLVRLLKHKDLKPILILPIYLVVARSSLKRLTQQVA